MADTAAPSGLSDHQDSHTGMTLGERWRVGTEIGTGGMAIVYEGQDLRLGRKVACKVMHPHLAESEDTRRRLEREAKAIAQVRHPHIIEVYDYSTADPRCTYLITELVEGSSLRLFTARHGPPPLPVALMIVADVLAALEAAHQRGIIHRDVKPDNILVGADGRLKLSDFGIAKIVSDTRLTLTGHLVGSPSYMAPEQADGLPCTPRSDVFSTGVVLYELVCGVQPFRGRSVIETIRQIVDGEFADPARVEPNAWGAPADIIRRALMHRPDDRYPSAAAMAAELRAVLLNDGYTDARRELAQYFSAPAAYIADFTARTGMSVPLRKPDDLGRPSAPLNPEDSATLSFEGDSSPETGDVEPTAPREPADGPEASEASGEAAVRASSAVDDDPSSALALDRREVGGRSAAVISPPEPADQPPAKTADDGSESTGRRRDDAPMGREAESPEARPGSEDRRSTGEPWFSVEDREAGDEPQALDRPAQGVDALRPGWALLSPEAIRAPSTLGRDAATGPAADPSRDGSLERIAAASADSAASAEARPIPHGTPSYLPASDGGLGAIDGRTDVASPESPTSDGDDDADELTEAGSALDVPPSVSPAALLSPEDRPVVPNGAPRTTAEDRSDEEEEATAIHRGESLGFEEFSLSGSSQKAEDLPTVAAEAAMAIEPEPLVTTPPEPLAEQAPANGGAEALTVRQPPDRRSSAQHPLAEHRSAEHRSAEHRSAEHRSAEHRSAEHRSAEHRSADHRWAEHQAWTGSSSDSPTWRQPTPEAVQQAWANRAAQRAQEASDAAQARERASQAGAPDSAPKSGALRTTVAVLLLIGLLAALGWLVQGHYLTRLSEALRKPSTVQESDQPPDGQRTEPESKAKASPKKRK